MPSSCLAAAASAAAASAAALASMSMVSMPSMSEKRSMSESTAPNGGAAAAGPGGEEKLSLRTAGPARPGPTTAMMG